VIRAIISWSVDNRVFVVLLAVLALALGAWAFRETPVDAIPDLSDVQVIVQTDLPGQSPEVVDDQVTFPLASALLATPGARDVRGYSFFGFSLVYVIFEDGTDLYEARSRVLEGLSTLQGKLPAGTAPVLGPDATGVGWVFQYALADLSPHAAALRQRLDGDKDGIVSEAEAARTWGLEDLEQVYAEIPVRLKGVTPDDAAASMLSSFDRDRSGLLEPGELAAAANFRGIPLHRLRTLQDTVLRYELTALDGVAEVASLGGQVRQYQVEVDPEELRAFGVTLPQVRQAIARSNLDVGGRVLEMGETEYMVRGQGYVRGLDDLEQIPVAASMDAHAPVLLSQVARVQEGPAGRRGIADLNGEGEVVSGIVVMRAGENARAVIDRVRTRLDELGPSLPPGVDLRIGYDRSGLIDRAIASLLQTLGEEMLIVSLVCALFLLHLRSALVAVVVLPLGVLLSFVVMYFLGIVANIMSLGGIAIAIGVMVDASVVLVENVHKHRERDPDGSQVEVVKRAAVEVGPALFASLLVVTVSFLPVFALQQQEGRLFHPLAATKTLSMAFASVLAVTVIPALAVVLVRGRIRPESKQWLSRGLIALYEPVIRGVMRVPALVVVLGVLLGATAVFPALNLGSEFMPPLYEGDLLYMPTTPPGLSITTARDVLQETDRAIAEHPQVAQVLGKAGRADTATDPAPLTMLETLVVLTPQETWPAGKTPQDVIRELDAMVQVPGLTNAWTMPIKTRLDMLSTGIKTPVGIKLMGSDLDELSRVGQEIEAVVSEVPGATSVFAERVVGGRYVDITVRRGDAARYGLTVADVQDVVRTAIGGAVVSEAIDGLERIPITVRLPRELRHDLATLRDVAVPTPMGHTVPLAQVADLAIDDGPPAIKSENARRTAWVYVDTDSTDISGFVSRARDAVDARVQLPPGVTVRWSGQYEHLQRAFWRLVLIVPVTLAIVLVLLYLHFRKLVPTLVVMGGTLLLAPVGGFWLMWLLDTPFSVASAVGFIALAGLAAETGVVMLVYLEQAYEEAVADGRMNTLTDLRAAVHEGAVARLRPKVMTVATTLLGLLPILIGTGVGATTMQRIALPMVGGLVSSLVLTLVVIPAVYVIWRRGSVGSGREG